VNKRLKEKIYEAFSSVLPITMIVLLLSILVVPLPIGTSVMFLVGAALLIVGMGLFSLGADIAMMPMGEGVGIQLTKTKKLGLMAFLTLLMGLLITYAEPDLQVLANQVPSIENLVLITSVAVGVGVFLVVAILRILFQIRLATVLVVAYTAVFILSIFTPDAYKAVAFDSGGVTTGPITVPFILAMGLGVASIRGDKQSREDSFGLVALCSIGPILAVMLLGMFHSGGETGYTQVTVPAVETTRDVVRTFGVELPHYLGEVFIALIPIVVFFLIFQIISRRFSRRQLARMAVGMVYTLLGLVLFLTGVNVGFIPVGHLFGSEIAASPYRWILVPIAMLIGYFIVSAEPAVHVLNKQVEEVSNGAISQKDMKLGLSVGMCVSLGLSMIRILQGISLYWFLIPGYGIALLLTFFVPKIFTGIAFDSGGVATGPMTSTFLLPFAMGACNAAGGNILTDAFGIVAVVAMTPLIVIQLMGLFYRKRIDVPLDEEIIPEAEDDIIEYDEEESPHA
jgi:hypothetical protein